MFFRRKVRVKTVFPLVYGEMRVKESRKVLEFFDF